MCPVMAHHLWPSCAVLFLRGVRGGVTRCSTVHPRFPGPGPITDGGPEAGVSPGSRSGSVAEGECPLCPRWTRQGPPGWTHTQAIVKRFSAKKGEGCQTQHFDPAGSSGWATKRNENR